MKLAVLVSLGTALLSGCVPDLGDCDETLARQVVYSDDPNGLPAYAGQALIQQSCGNGSFCHSERATSRFGVPRGLDFDLELAVTAEDTELLRRGQETAYKWRHHILDTIRAETMPPGPAGQNVAEAGRQYRDLPALNTPEAEAILENWLACGLPVVERTADDRQSGIAPVGAIVPAVPTGTMPPMSCSEAEMLCSGRCIGVLEDARNCGGCGVTCDLGRACSVGACDMGCGGGLSDCGGSCVDTEADRLHCGGCDNTCADTEVCALGSCTSEGCPEGTANCDGSCANVQTSILNCGGCDAPCAAGESCEMGMCSCGDTASDPLNCGACGRVCAAGTDCQGGECVCSGGLSLCGTRCIDTQRDPANCGGCGNACGSGQTCEAGDCVSCGTGISFSGDIQPMFNGSCNGSMCHSGARPAASLTLVDGQSHAALVGVASGCPDDRPLVEVGAPEGSYLVNKLTGVGNCRGNRMPLRAPAWSADQIDTVRNWICAGAPNN